MDPLSFGSISSGEEWIEDFRSIISLICPQGGIPGLCNAGEEFVCPDSNVSYQSSGATLWVGCQSEVNGMWWVDPGHQNQGYPSAFDPEYYFDLKILNPQSGESVIVPGAVHVGR